LPKERGLHRHLHLATSASLAAFIGIIGVGGLVLLQQTIGRPPSPNVEVSDRDPSMPVQGRDIVPLGENRGLEADSPPAVTAAAPLPPPDEPAKQTTSVTEGAALPSQQQTAPAAPEITLRSSTRSAEPANAIGAIRPATERRRRARDAAAAAGYRATPGRKAIGAYEGARAVAEKNSSPDA
jgi:hypothetical protein